MNRYNFLLILSLIISLQTGCEKDDLSNLNDNFFLETEGATLPVWVQGNAESNVFILILHGGPGGDGYVYNTLTKEMSEPLEEDYALIYMDQRGSGNATGNYDRSTLSIPQFVEDLEKLVLLLKDRYGEDIRLFLMGHSWGGLLGSAYLVKDNNQDQIAGWLEVDGAHNITLLNQLAVSMFIEIGDSEIANGNNVDEWEEIVEYCGGLDPQNISNDESGKLNAFGGTAEGLLLNSGLIESPSIGIRDLLGHELFTPTNALTELINLIATNSALTDEVYETEISEELANITIPCAFLWGRYDFHRSSWIGTRCF